MPGLGKRPCLPPLWNDERLVMLRRLLCILLAGCLGLVMMHSAEAETEKPAPQVALYLGPHPPVDELQAFDQVVLDPRQVDLTGVDQSRYAHTRWLAKVPVPSEASQTTLAVWLEGQIQPLWNQGFRGFLLAQTSDSLNPYPSGESAAPSSRILAAVLTALRARFPEATLLLRNQTDFVTQHPGWVQGLVLDSLVRSYHLAGWQMAIDPQRQKNDLQIVQNLHQMQPTLNIVDVEFCARPDRGCRQQVARQAIDLGLNPYVTDPEYRVVGIGRVEVMPRQLLVLQALNPGAPPETGTAARVLGMPIDYLGYLARYVNVNERLPEDIDNDRYAGIVLFVDHPVNQPGRLRNWLLGRMAAGVKVAVFQSFGFDLDTATAARLGFTIAPSVLPAGSVPRLEFLDPMLSFERPPQLTSDEVLYLHAGRDIRVLGRVGMANQHGDLAGLTPWGGYVLAPFCLTQLTGDDLLYWVVRPLEFLRQALVLPVMPVPDVTSENGRRLWFTHVDGDGFISRTEFSGNQPFAIDALMERVIKRYPLPITLSVIEGEISPRGRYPDLSAHMQAMARQAFALPQVELGSHGYTHVLDWVRILEPGAPLDQLVSIPLPGYAFSLEREIFGSIDYIRRELAPPGKAVRLMQWSGAANPTGAALRLAHRAGVLNINGGYTAITSSKPSWTLISGVGIDKGNGLEEEDTFQIYAAEVNENIYTDDWTHAFYGMQRSLETYALTETPLRLKPVDLYYHYYSGTKLASLAALQRIYQQLLQQNLFPVFTSGYVQRVLDSRHAVIARRGSDWRVRTGPFLRELRLPSGFYPQWNGAQGVLGYVAGPGGVYVHLDRSEATFTLASTPPPPSVPYVALANGEIHQTQRLRDGRSLAFQLTAYGRPQVQLQAIEGCQILADGQKRIPDKAASELTLSWPFEERLPLATHHVEVDCE